MSQSLPHTTHELSCPNCGGPYDVHAFGNQVTCEYCGSRFVIPESVRASAPAFANAPNIQVNVPEGQADVARWVKWLVIFIVVVTVVPTVCGVLAAVCGVLAPLSAFFFGR